VIDLDYRLHEVFKFAYKGVLPKKLPRREPPKDGQTVQIHKMVKRGSMAGATFLPSNSVAPAPGLPANAVETETNGRERGATERTFPVDGISFGAGTNIFSIYADPEDPATWELYNLQKADLVVSCMWNRDQTSLCTYMKPASTPLMLIAENNKAAKELYEKGATFCLQQDFFCAKAFCQMLKEESQKMKETDSVFTRLFSTEEQASHGVGGVSHESHAQSLLSISRARESSLPTHTGAPNKDHQGNELHGFFSERGLDAVDDLEDEERDAILKTLAPFL